MGSESAAYIELLNALRTEVKDLIEGMGPDQLNWAPLDDDTNSPGVLVAHIAGSESFWVHQVVGGMDVNRDRDAEFAMRASNAADLQGHLDRIGETSSHVLMPLSGDDLDQTKTARPGEPPVSLRYAVLHQIEHMGQHLGHLSLTAQLYSATRHD